MVFEVARDALVEVDHVVPHHVVALSGIDEVVGLGAGIFAGAEESEGVLEHAGGVVVADDDLQAAFELRGVAHHAGFGIALGIGLRRFHVALTVHGFVVFPVENGTAGDTDFEDFGVGEHEVRRHESAEAPTVHADAGGVDEGEGREVFDALHLIGHLDAAEVAVGATFEFETAVARSAVVENEEDVVAVGHVVFPRAGLVVPRLLDVGGVGAAVDVDDGGILLVGIEVDGLDESVVEGRFAVGGQDASAFDAGHGELSPGVSGFEQAKGFARALGAAHNDVAVGAGRRPGVAQQGTARRELGAVHAYAVVEEGATPGFEIDGIEVLANVSALVAADDDAAGAGVETEEFEHLKLTGSELLEQLAFGVEEVEVVEAVALALVDELVFVPRQERERVLGFDETLVGFGVEHPESRAGVGVVGDEVAALLRTRHFHDVEAVAVGAPTEVGEVAIGGIAEIEPDGAIVLRIEDADGDLMRGHARHGVLLGRGLGDAHGRGHVDVDERIVGDHALVHAIEGETASVEAPESAFVNAEFVAVDGGAVEQLTVAVGGNGVAASVGGGDVEIIVLGVGQGLTRGSEVLVFDASFEWDRPFDATIFPIVAKERAGGAKGGNGTTGFGEGGGGERTQHAATGGVERGIDLGEGEKRCAFRIEMPTGRITQL